MNAEDRTCTSSRTRWLLVLLGVFYLALALRADAGAPCCAITAIDLRTGLVTARVTATGRTFQFAVTDPALLKTLKLGQAVQADFRTMKVSLTLNPLEPCCGIVVRPAEPVGKPPR